MKTRQPGTAESLASRLVGTWKLLTREDRALNGEPRVDPALGSDPTALLFFDQAGHFAAQFMKRDRGNIVSEVAAITAAPNNSRARGGYDAYFGTYEVDEAKGAVTTTLMGALSPENVGQTFTRHMSVSGDKLTIRLETKSTAGEPIIRTLQWERVG